MWSPDGLVVKKKRKKKARSIKNRGCVLAFGKWKRAVEGQSETRGRMQNTARCLCTTRANFNIKCPSVSSISSLFLFCFFFSSFLTNGFFFTSSSSLYHWIRYVCGCVVVEVKDPCQGDVSMAERRTVGSLSHRSIPIPTRFHTSSIVIS